ncbi:MAG: HD domain-containing phosphohydrolase, partial [Desulfohalobiaceae bacterium]
PFAVVVSDMRMPGMDGVSFLTRVKKLHPDSVRVILTGYADLESAIASVNKGHVFRFLTKPSSPEEMGLALKDCIRQYRLIRSERELLQGTLRGTINVLTDVLSLTNPEAFGRASRVKRLVKDLAAILKAKHLWKFELAGMLSQIGCVTLPQMALQKLYQGQELSQEEVQLFEMHPSLAQSLLQHIPRLEDVSSMIGYQEKHYNGEGFPRDSLKGEQIPLGARILKVALDFDLLRAEGLKKAQAFSRMQSRKGVYDPNVLKALEEYLGQEAHYLLQDLKLKDLLPGMLFAQEVRTRDGILLVARGQEANRVLLQKLENFSRNFGIDEPVKMYVPLRSG